MHTLILIMKKRQSNPNGGTLSKRISLHSPQTTSAVQTVEGCGHSKADSRHGNPRKGTLRARRENKAGLSSGGGQAQG